MVRYFAPKGAFLSVRHTTMLLRRLGKTVFPDFFYPPAQEWWQSEIAQYHSILKFDGLWIDMK